MYSFGLVAMLGWAIFYYKVGDLERGSGIVLGGLSLGLWLLTAQVLGLGLLGCMLAQGGIFVGLTIRNVLKDGRRDYRPPRTPPTAP